MNTKDKIIDRTFELLLCKGYDGVSISDIQNSLEISRGLLYHYFGNKETLFFEAIKCKFSTHFYIDLELIKYFNLDEMTSYIIDKYRMLDSNILQGVSILNYDFLFYRAMQESEELAKLYGTVRSNEQNGWLLALQNSFENGELREGLNLEALSAQYIYVTDGVWLGAVTPSVEVDLISSLKEALATLNFLVKK